MQLTCDNQLLHCMHQLVGVSELIPGPGWLAAGLDWDPTWKHCKAVGER
jgi:hypothetical protein